MAFSFLQEFADVCKQENVVVNRSGNFKVFHEMESALKWLGVEK